MTRIADAVVSHKNHALRKFRSRTAFARSFVAPAIFGFLLSIAVLQAQRPIPDDDHSEISEPDRDLAPVALNLRD